MIRIANIVSIKEDFVIGNFGAKKVILNIEGKEAIDVNAYAKPLSPTQLIIEIVASLLGRELALPIPEPIIAIHPQHNNPWFASVDLKLPDLTKAITQKNGEILNSSNNVKIFSQLANWQQINLACVFDEWIANEDRNIGNILFDGKDSFHLIDHNLAMALPFAENRPINNELLNINTHFNAQDEITKQRIKATIIHTGEQLDARLPAMIAKKLTTKIPLLISDDLDKLVNFLNQRLKFLGKIAETSIKTKQQKLI